jgi:antitoxin component YwqK of YwqJK toxin-antitoxin module
MGKQKHINLIFFILAFTCFSSSILLAQTTGRDLTVMVNDSVKLNAHIEEYKKLSLLVDKEKIVDISYWPNKSIRGIVLRLNDTSCIKLGFNYVGKIISQAQYKFIGGSLIAEGIHYHFTDDGILSHIYFYKNGQLDGFYKSYYENGVLESYGEYLNGTKKGTWFYYSKKGAILKKENF